MCQKSSWACRNAKSLSERSEFDLADTETTNFWQRSRHSLEFSLMLDFAHVQQIENKFSFVFTQSQNCLSFLLVKQKKWKSKNIDQSKPSLQIKPPKPSLPTAGRLKEGFFVSAFAWKSPLGDLGVVEIIDFYPYLKLLHFALFCTLYCTTPAQKICIGCEPKKIFL